VAVRGVEFKSKSQLQHQNGVEVSGRLVRLLLIALSEPQMYNPTFSKATNSHSLKTHDSEALSQRMNKALVVIWRSRRLVFWHLNMNAFAVRYIPSATEH
jgi:hypothetical protein